MRLECFGRSRRILFGLLLASAVAFAAPDASAARKLCSESDPAYEDTGKRMKCKMENMADSFDSLVTTAVEDDTEFFTPTQKRQLGNLKERMRNETGRVHPIDYKRYGAKDQRDVECVIRERIGDVADAQDLDGNGICDEGEVCLGNEDGVCQEDEFVFDQPYKGGCAEALEDGIGDEDGICDPRGNSGKFREACLEDCSQDVVLAEGEEKNVDRGKSDDVEQAFEDMTEVMDEADADLRFMIAARRSFLAAREVSQLEPLTACEELNALLQGGRTVDALGLSFATATASVAKVVEDACKDTLQWDAVVTASAACIPTTLVGEGLNILAVRLEAIDDAETGERVDAVGECVQTTGGDVVAIEAMLQSIKQMLLEPQGQRFDDKRSGETALLDETSLPDEAALQGETEQPDEKLSKKEQKALKKARKKEQKALKKAQKES